MLSELVTYNASGEIPDVIGWTARASILFECKMSRADFLADRKKPFRCAAPELGVGGWRFYLTVPGVVRSTYELPIGWGVYELQSGRLVHVMGAKYSNAGMVPNTPNFRAELALLRSHIRRMESGQ